MAEEEEQQKTRNNVEIIMCYMYVRTKYDVIYMCVLILSNHYVQFCETFVQM